MKLLFAMLVSAGMLLLAPLLAKDCAGEPFLKPAALGEGPAEAMSLVLQSWNMMLGSHKLSCQSPAPVVVTVHKWRDSSGNWHFSDRVVDHADPADETMQIESQDHPAARKSLGLSTGMLSALLLLGWMLASGVLWLLAILMERLLTRPQHGDNDTPAHEHPVGHVPIEYSRETPYEILGINENANLDAVHKAYQEHLRLHLDLISSGKIAADDPVQNRILLRKQQAYDAISRAIKDKFLARSHNKQAPPRLKADGGMA